MKELTDEDLTVYYNETPQYRLNKNLLIGQKVVHNLEAIKAVHETKLLFYDLITQTNDLTLLRGLATDIQHCEFELQKLWGFKEDTRFHRFWEAPKCSCPKLDNEDRYPTGHYVVNLSCLLHGK